MLQLPEERLKELGAAITVKETLGQPDLWRKEKQKLMLS